MGSPMKIGWQRQGGQVGLFKDRIGPGDYRMVAKPPPLPPLSQLANPPQSQKQVMFVPSVPPPPVLGVLRNGVWSGCAGHGRGSTRSRELVPREMIVDSGQGGTLAGSDTGYRDGLNLGRRQVGRSGAQI